MKDLSPANLMRVDDVGVTSAIFEILFNLCPEGISEWLRHYSDLKQIRLVDKQLSPTCLARLNLYVLTWRLWH